MKELSIEQKAKRYDEALEKARQLCAYPTSKPFISDLQDLFPELKESEVEDEIIRKGIIKELVQLIDNIKIITNETSVHRHRLYQYIEWLEKQGEQKPAWSEEDIATISRVISIIKWAAYSDHSHPILNDKGATELVEQLKSLKNRVQPQTAWKPSEAQIASLTIACDRNDRIGFDLTQLLKELKKLKA